MRSDQRIPLGVCFRISMALALSWSLLELVADSNRRVSSVAILKQETLGKCDVAKVETFATVRYLSSEEALTFCLIRAPDGLLNQIGVFEEPLNLLGDGFCPILGVD